MKNHIQTISEMRSILLLWGSQLISGIGSAMTGYALVIWSYAERLRTGDSHADGLHLRAPCAVQYFRGSAQ